MTEEQHTNAPATLTPIAEYSNTVAALADLRQRYASVVYDVAKPEGMQAARAARRELVKLRTTLEAKRIEIKAPALERCRFIDSEAKRITAELLALESPIDQQIQKEEDRKAAEKAKREQEERERVAGIQAKIDAIRSMVLMAVSATAGEIAGLVANLQAAHVTVEEYAELLEDATRARSGTLTKLGEMYDARAEQEAEAIRLKAEREQLDRQRAEEDQRQAAERARLAEEDRQHRQRLDHDAADRERVAALRFRVDNLARTPVTVIGRHSTVIAAVHEELRRETTDAIKAGAFGELTGEAETALMNALDQLVTMRIDAEHREAIAAESQRQAQDRDRLAAEERRQQEERERQAEAARKAEADKVERERVAEEERHAAEQRAATRRERLKELKYLSVADALYAIYAVVRSAGTFSDALAREEVVLICEANLPDKRRPPRKRDAMAESIGATVDGAYLPGQHENPAAR